MGLIMINKLFEAARVGNSDDVNNYMDILYDERRYNIESFKSLSVQSNLLSVAVSYGHHKMLELLINAGCNVNLFDTNSWLPIHSAAFNGNVEIMEMLINARADIDLKTNRRDTGVSALYIATKEGHAEIVRTLIRNMVKVNTLNGSNKETALHCAAFYNNIEIINTFISERASLNIRDANGNTALHVAVMKGNIDAMSTLLEKRAKVTITNKYGDTPLHIAVNGGVFDAIEVLVKYMGKEGTDIVNNSGKTALQIAVHAENSDMVKALLDAGVKPNRSLNSYVANNGHENIVWLFTEAEKKEQLLRAAARSDTAMLYEAIAGLEELYANDILGFMVALDSRDNCGSSALHKAVYNNNFEMVEMLIKKGASVGAININRLTPLNIAINNNNIDIINLLCEAQGINDPYNTNLNAMKLYVCQLSDFPQFSTRSSLPNNDNAPTPNITNSAQIAREMSKFPSNNNGRNF